MRVLVTGSSGWLGRTLVPMLEAEGHAVTGLDTVAGPTTHVLGSITDRPLVFRIMTGAGIEAVIHAATLHKPHVATHSQSDFVAINIQGTLNLLEAATAGGSAVDRFVFTSTTSLMISAGIRAGRAGGAVRAAWITEAMTGLRPRNIYGVTKLAAEHLCRLTHEQHGLPLVILRTSRFFPEADDMAHAIPHSDANTKANELLFRRLTVEDAAAAHLAALANAPGLGFDTFIVSARTPFSPDDCALLITDAPAVVARYFPEYPRVYDRLGWTMFQSIDRVYDASHAARHLGFTCRTDFARKLAELEAGH
ncbi:MAG: NAD(P)-dependent oxidoreductase [Geminicoccaceae bacterium]